MPKLTDLGHRLGKLAAKVRKRNEEDKNADKVMVDSSEDHGGGQQSLSSGAEDPSVSHPLRSILAYAPGRWMDESSLADDSSTIAKDQQQDQEPLNPVSSSLHAIVDPSYQVRDRDEVRATDNWAVQRISSMLSTRSEESFYYNRYGDVREHKLKRKHHGHGHLYCCPNPKEIQKGKRNLFPYEEVDLDWHIQALKDYKAGQWSIDDFSPQHLQDRLFFNANIILPSNHLQGTQQAAAQELRAGCIENDSLKASSSWAVERAKSLEQQLKDRKEELERLDEVIEELRSLWEAHLRQ